jgi:hypothetical protein
MVFAVVKRDGARETPTKTKWSEKGSEYIKGMKLKICRRAKNYGAIRQAV